MPEEQELKLDSLAIDKENILVQVQAASREEIIRRLGALLLEHGYVRDSYTQAVLDREQIFPTGLQTPILGFAIPHTDTDHVTRPAIAIATLASPVTFQAMGEPETEIPVTVVMMLAVSDPKAVVVVLRRVISILEDEQALRGLIAAATPQEVRDIVQEHIQRMAEEIPADSNLEVGHV